MRVLITGAPGQLATELLHRTPAGANTRTVSRAECDITDLAAIDAIVKAFHPDTIINAAAYTAVDKAEDNAGEAFAANAEGARNVSAAATRAGAHMIQISTDYVFDGRRSTPYGPDAEPNPISIYGASKLAGERAVAEAAPSATIVRSGWLYAAGGKGFLSAILLRVAGGESLRVVDDQVGVPTSAREFADFLWWLVGHPEHAGLMHWVNAGQASRYEFAKAIAELARDHGLLEQVPDIEPIATSDLVMRARRPAYSVLDATESWLAFGKPATPWREALSSTLDEIAVARA